MSLVIHHPKRCQNCVFCRFWIGDAKMTLVNSVSGYKYDTAEKGRCTKKNGAATIAGYTCRTMFEPSEDAKKLL